VLGKRGVHFIGIGGIGMSGIAELLANLGPSWSDEKTSSVTDRLETLASASRRDTTGQCRRGRRRGGVAAVRPSNVKSGSRRRQILVIPRAEMLAELMRLRFHRCRRRHGKTTTTSMIALMLSAPGSDGGH
jgi:UDP-N-acetylmuramate--alanine ligase